MQEWDIEINLYNLCLENKVLNGEKITILFHVDDLNIFHKYPKAVIAIIGLLNKKCGQEIVSDKRAPLTIEQGASHK